VWAYVCGHVCAKIGQRMIATGLNTSLCMIHSLLHRVWAGLLPSHAARWTIDVPAPGQ
jgi:hypothetical protein